MKEEFDTSAAGQSSYAVPIAVQERHLAVLRDLVAPPSLVRRKPVSRRAAIVAISVVVLAGAGVGTAAAFGAFSKPTDRGLSHCYTAASLDAAHNDFALATATGARRATRRHTRWTSASATNATEGCSKAQTV